jgi:hypothetical protein
MMMALMPNALLGRVSEVVGPLGNGDDEDNDADHPRRAGGTVGATS